MNKKDIKRSFLPYVFLVLLLIGIYYMAVVGNQTVNKITYDKFLDELSGGQRQRAFIGMVLAQDTDYIFLDEPLNNLDMKHSVQIMKMLRRITDELGKTVVIVIHDINFASCYSDEIIALQDGEIAVTGTVNEIMQASTLSKLYDMEFNVQEINDKKICVYY